MNQSFKNDQLDILGRPIQISDFSGTRTLAYNNDCWFLESETWSAGLLNGFQLVHDQDLRGRSSLLELKKAGSTFYSAVPSYRHESESLKNLTVSGPGFPAVEIRYSGDGGVADAVEYRVDNQSTFSWSRQRGNGGRLEAIVTGKPEFDQSWTVDAFGRVHVLTRQDGNTTFSYADNGSLARAQRNGDDREYVFSDRGELTQEKLNGQVLAATFDPNKSGAASFRENLRQFTLRGSAHAEATLSIFAHTNLVGTVTSPFAVTLSESHYPGMAQSNGPFPWKVTGERPGVDYLGGFAIADIEGEAWLPDAEESLIISYGRRSQDSLLSYTWNAADQLLAAQQRHGPLRVENVYDGQQRRVEKRVYKHGNLQQVHRFVYEGWLPVVEEVSDKWDNLIYRNLYVWGPGPDGVRNPAIGATGQLALIIHQPKTGPAQLSAPVYNHRLDIVGLVDVETGNVVARYDNEPFGRQTTASGTRAHHCPFRFASSYFDSEVGLNYFGYRHYDSRTKQWISRDPIGEAGGLNLFAYADNDPINGIDILGLKNFIEVDENAKIVRFHMFALLKSEKVKSLKGLNVVTENYFSDKQIENFRIKLNQTLPSAFSRLFSSTGKISYDKTKSGIQSYPFEGFSLEVKLNLITENDKDYIELYNSLYDERKNKLIEQVSMKGSTLKLTLEEIENQSRMSAENNINSLFKIVTFTPARPARESIGLIGLNSPDAVIFHEFLHQLGLEDEYFQTPEFGKNNRQIYFISNREYPQPSSPMVGDESIWKQWRLNHFHFQAMLLGRSNTSGLYYPGLYNVYLDRKLNIQSSSIEMQKAFPDSFRGGKLIYMHDLHPNVEKYRDRLIYE